MVSAASRFPLAVAFALCLVPSLPAKEPADYRIGDTVEADIVAPVQLIVINSDRTVALRYTEGRRFPVIFRFYPGTADEAENGFRSAFATARSNFITAVEAVFRRSRLDESATAQPEFQIFVAAFQSQNRAFPLSTNLAALWAQGDAGRALQSAWSAQLRAVMERPVCIGALPEEFDTDGPARLVAVTNRDEALTFETAVQRGANIARSNVLVLARAKDDLPQTAPPEERAFARFAASFLKPNCFLDASLTRQNSAKAAEQIVATDIYERGQIIARRGQVIDKKIMTALDQLREKTQLGELQQQITQQKTQAMLISERNRWLLICLAGVTAILVLVIWRLGRRPQPVALLPTTAGSGNLVTVVPALPGGAARTALPENTGAEFWQQRAAAAEQRAQTATAAVRSGLLPHLAGLLKTKLVQGMISQRATMLDTQQKAAADIAQLDRKLDQLQTPLKERLRAYERRIAELETELAQKGDENRELLRAKISLAKKQLEAERAKPRLVVHPGKPNAWEIRLKPGANSIGRGSGNDFKIDDPSVSMSHCQIVVSDVGAVIKDLGSTNGTHIDNAPVQAAVLRPAQRILLGTVEMLFEGDAPLPAPPIPEAFGVVQPALSQRR
jgi:hypothetical protein